MMLVEINALESERFGVRFARLEASGLSPGGIAEAVAAADADGVDVVSARVDASDLARVRALEDAGFRIMDVLVYHRLPLPAADSEPAGSLRPHDLGRADADAAAAVAGQAFEGYMGHYHMDPRLSDAAANDTYADWAARLLSEPAPDQISLGTAVGGELTGFLIGRSLGDGTSEIILNAVSPKAQRGGHYTALLHGYLRRATDRGDTGVVISTQLQNHRVQRAWARAGFCLHHSLITLHRWAPA